MTEPLEHPDDLPKLSQASARRADIVAWLRSPEALRTLVAHVEFNSFGFCDGCGRAYPRYAAHLLEELAKAVES